MDARGGDTVELHEGDKPWAALMIPHGGGNTQRDNGFITPHTRGEYRETYQRAKQTMSVCTPCALRFYISSTARGRYTHSRLRGDETPTQGREGRERSSVSALQQVLIDTTFCSFYGRAARRNDQRCNDVAKSPQLLPKIAKTTLATARDGRAYPFLECGRNHTITQQAQRYGCSSASHPCRSSCGRRSHYGNDPSA